MFAGLLNYLHAAVRMFRTKQIAGIGLLMREDNPLGVFSPNDRLISAIVNNVVYYLLYRMDSFESAEPTRH